MGAIRQTVRGLFGDEQGATAIEYGLIVALIAVSISGALSLMGGGSNGMWTTISTRIEAAMSPVNAGGAGS